MLSAEECAYGLGLALRLKSLKKVKSFSVAPFTSTFRLCQLDEMVLGCRETVRQRAVDLTCRLRDARLDRQRP